jgi:hypothetical protein
MVAWFSDGSAVGYVLCSPRMNEVGRTPKMGIRREGLAVNRSPNDRLQDLEAVC